VDRDAKALAQTDPDGFVVAPGDAGGLGQHARRLGLAVHPHFLVSHHPVLLDDVDALHRRPHMLGPVFRG